MISAVFDLDGTLYTGDIIKGIAKHHIHHKVKLINMAAYFVVHYCESSKRVSVSLVIWAGP